MPAISQLTDQLAMPRTRPGDDGFQRLVGEVALGKVGIILGLEVS